MNASVSKKNSTEEKEFPSDVNLISTTDPSSIITSANQVFCDVADYQESELVGKPHNIIRHSDMPKAAFKQLWDTVKSGKSWMGVVKNARKDGGFYWVSAFVTPITDASGKIIEYQSVRSKPKREWIKRATDVYAQLAEGKTPAKLKYPRFTFSWGRKLFTGITIASSLAVLAGGSPVFFASLSLLAMLGMGVNGFFHQRRLAAVTELAKQGYDNPLMELVYCKNYDEYSLIELALHKRNAQIRAIAARATGISSEIHESERQALSSLENTKMNIMKQSIETDSVATAMTEMAQSIHDVANSASEAAKVVEQVNQLANQGSTNVETTINSVADLQSALEQAKSIINDLSESSLQIESILEVIGNIADQTNLLALNAAIEAARAGESGRGFAVVADEVRTLASKTQSSTEEIQNMIFRLQNSTRQAVTAMDEGNKLSDICTDNAVSTGDVLKQVNVMLVDVSKNSYQIASAVEQQASVTNEINTNVHVIQQLSEENNSLSESSVSRTSAQVTKLDSLQRLMQQFMKLHKQ